MNNSNNKQHGFRIYKDDRGSLPKTYERNVAGSAAGASNLGQDDRNMEVAFLKKLHAQTKIVGFLVYHSDIKGIRFFDPLKRKFIDIAPWQLNRFALSKLQLMGIRQIDLVRHEAGESKGTVVVEFLSKYEAAGYYRANRMVSSDLAEALSGITNYMLEDEYQALLKEVQNGNLR